HMRFKKLGLFFLLGLFGLLQQIAHADTSADEEDDGGGDDNTTVTVPAKSSDAIGNMLLQSISLIGIPYRWGGNTPETGMDCSGFIRYLYKTSLGINLPRTASEMSKVGKRISLDDIEPGDLLFFNTRRGANTHVGMFLGNNRMIVAPRTGQDIQITVLDSYWRNHCNGAKRIVQENEDDVGNTSLESFQEKLDEALPGGSHKKHSIRRGKKGRSRYHNKGHHTTKKVSKKSVHHKAKKSKVKKKTR
ncbi:MAG TPA: C40 family peptidase, partial [Aquella sp.]|nr:C40 family peptidase [Aquella sp.]